MGEDGQDVRSCGDAVTINVGWARVGELKLAGPVIEVGARIEVGGFGVGATREQAVFASICGVWVKVDGIEVRATRDLVFITHAVAIGVILALAVTIRSSLRKCTRPVVESGARIKIAGGFIRTPARRSYEKRGEGNGPRAICRENRDVEAAFNGCRTGELADQYPEVFSSQTDII